MNEQPETFWAWLAGFIDGDGSFGVYANGPNVYPKLTIAQKDRAVLDYIVESVGLGSVAMRGHGSTGKVMHALTYGSRASMEVAKRVLPYLIVKKADAAAMLDFQHIPKYERKNAPERNPLYQRALEMYQQGMSASAIGETLGIKGPTVNFWVRRAELTRDYREAQVLRRAREKASAA